jgi:hypothetical protein
MNPDLELSHLTTFSYSSLLDGGLTVFHRVFPVVRLSEIALSLLFNNSVSIASAGGTGANT